MEKECEGCGGLIGHLPESTKLFNIRPVNEPGRKAELCLSCITHGITEATKQMKKGRVAKG